MQKRKSHVKIHLSIQIGQEGSVCNTSEVWRNLTIHSEGASEIYFHRYKTKFFDYFGLFLIDLEEIFPNQTSQFTKSLYLVSNSKKKTAK